MLKRLTICIISMIALASPAFAQAEGSYLATHTQQIRNHSYLAFKTNLLYDAVLIPNLGVEFNIYKNLTIYGDLMYADWNIPAKHIYWDLYGAQVGVRKYFGKIASHRSFSGHHAGIYGLALAYDFQAGNIGQQTPLLNMGAGIDYGYSFPVTLGFNIDIEVGIGYLGGKYYEYAVLEGHNSWRGTIKRNYFGPTKASVSLVWLIKSKKQTSKE